jgi:hypothetical protein
MKIGVKPRTERGGPVIHPEQLEQAYLEFSRNFTKWVPDGILTINLVLLEELGLLNRAELDEKQSSELKGPSFHVIETAEKVTLFNDQFAIWIVPCDSEEKSSTLVYIALITGSFPHLEVVFSTSGVYNSPKYILKILQHFLQEVLDTEKLISIMTKSK